MVRRSNFQLGMEQGARDGYGRGNAFEREGPPGTGTVPFPAGTRQRVPFPEHFSEMRV